HWDVPIAYVGHAPKWDDVRIDGDPAALDCAVTYVRGGREVAVATIDRDQVSLRVEAAQQRAIAAAGARGAPAGGSRRRAPGTARRGGTATRDRRRGRGRRARGRQRREVLVNGRNGRHPTRARPREAAKAADRVAAAPEQAPIGAPPHDVAQRDELERLVRRM